MPDENFCLFCGHSPKVVPERPEKVQGLNRKTEINRLIGLAKYRSTQKTGEKPWRKFYIGKTE